GNIVLEASSGGSISYAIGVAPSSGGDFVKIDFTEIVSNEGGYVSVEQFDGSVWHVVGGASMPYYPGTIEVPYTGSAGNELKVHFTGNYYVKFKMLCHKVKKMTQEDVLVKICDDVEDKYSYGFNG